MQRNYNEFRNIILMLYNFAHVMGGRAGLGNLYCILLPFWLKAFGSSCSTASSALLRSKQVGSVVGIGSVPTLRRDDGGGPPFPFASAPCAWYSPVRLGRDAHRRLGGSVALRVHLRQLRDILSHLGTPRGGGGPGRPHIPGSEGSEP